MVGWSDSQTIRGKKEERNDMLMMLMLDVGCWMLEVRGSRFDV